VRAAAARAALAVGLVALLAAWRPLPPATLPLGLPPLPARADIPRHAAAIDLGRQLFFDRRLSANGSMSCAMCHVPEQGFASTASQRGVGMAGASLRRNAPSLLNVAWRPLLFWDGRADSLVAQAWAPLLHADEMGNASAGEVLARIRNLRDYRGRFERAFEDRGPGQQTVAQALAAFQATLVAADSRVDRWLYGGQPTLTPQEQAGLRLFTGSARCVQCHTVGEKAALWSDGRFHVTGAGSPGTGAPGRIRSVTLAPGVHTEVRDADLASFAPPPPPDLGRFDVTHDPAERHAFRTPSLRDVARTAPYMHDGSLATLEDVVAFYAQGGGDVAGQSPLLAPLALSDEDKAALVAFLRALDSADLPALVQRVRKAAPAP
jgi:cytochrome c peroxidase